MSGIFYHRRTAPVTNSTEYIDPFSIPHYSIEYQRFQGTNIISHVV